MRRGPFDPGFEQLPRVIPVFPLTGILLLPGGRLPLNVFEPRYLAMTRAALAEEYRIIGMIQPLEPDPDDNRGVGRSARDGEAPPLYKVGCAGRIVAFGETEDGRYMLTLSGLCRFEIAEEMTPKDGYRRVLADYHRFRRDLTGEADAGTEAQVDRDRLLAALKHYFDHRGISVDWKAIEAAPDDRLVTSLAMTCPFAPSERQALLEAPTLAARARTMTALLEMAAAEGGGASGARN